MNKKILYGICGIGNGHIYRQVPIIKHLIEEQNKILFFSYGKSFEYLNKIYKNNDNVKIIEVNVPYFIGDIKGLNFIKSEKINDINFNINMKAFAEAQKWLGKPDLVISDYEPYSAQYGYAYNINVLTIDQQSKYLLNSYPKELNGTSYLDEVMRLKMFFPIAKRIACSFFKIKGNKEIKIIPPIIREEILNLKKNSKKNNFLIYISAQDGFNQKVQDIIDILKNRKETFHIFTKNKIKEEYNNIKTYKHGDKTFEKILSECNGVITTAGHTLLSECVFLKIPIYAMPLKLYEQQLNAQMISKNHFGVQSEILNIETLEYFIKNIKRYKTKMNKTKWINNKNSFNFIKKKIDKLLRN